MQIGLVNESTVVDDASLHIIAAACAHQLRYHAAPAWDRHSPPVIAYKSLDQAPVTADVIAILDDADQQGALGYHDLTPDGRPYGKVSVKEVLDNGGTVLDGAFSVIVTASHEVLELFADPDINLWADDLGANQIALELCDPVEDEAYVVKVLAGEHYHEVPVSNFVTPAYFNSYPREGAKFDFLGSLSGPRTFTRGGYLIVRTAGEATDQFNAEGDDGFAYGIQAGDDVPGWKQGTKLAAAARTYRRIEASDPRRGE